PSCDRRQPVHPRAATSRSHRLGRCASAQDNQRSSMPRHLPTLLLAAAMLAGCTSAPYRTSAGDFFEREVFVDGRAQRYQVFVPARAVAPDAAPVILFLHGPGERGDDNRRPASVGLGPYVRERAASFPAIVVFPQAPLEAEWNQ